MITIANPIYDIVFKYLMEDERIARTILSALLQKDIVKVEVRPHEYSNNKRENLSVFRIDFGATVREADGSEHLILIELQKTWLPTETLRFRQYLGVQYENPQNIVKDSDDQHAIPMVAVYLLGHKVGDIEEPVIYVRHQTFDYNGKIVTKGLPNPFVDSLTHDSIIVQIPRLHGKINNRLDEVLSIFDQTRKSQQSQQMLDIDDSQYPEDDVEMQLILRRLLMAATNAEMRMDMNVEDEYFSIIENRDTALMLKDKEIARQITKLAEKKSQITMQKAKLDAQEGQLTAQKAKLDAQEGQLTAQKAKLDAQEAKIDEQRSTIQKSVQMPAQAGLTPEGIASNLDITPESVKEMLESALNKG